MPLILFSSKPPDGTKTKCSTFQNIRFSRCTCIFIFIFGDGDTCDDPRVWKNLQHPWIWYKLYELIIMFLFIYSQKYSQSLTGESGSCIKVCLVDVFKSEWSMTFLRYWLLEDIILWEKTVFLYLVIVFVSVNERLSSGKWSGVCLHIDQMLQCSESVYSAVSLTLHHWDTQQSSSTWPSSSSSSGLSQRLLKVCGAQVWYQFISSSILSKFWVDFLLVVFQRVEDRSASLRVPQRQQLDQEKQSKSAVKPAQMCIDMVGMIV